VAGKVKTGLGDCGPQAGFLACAPC
jgi:hypothetical protein